MIWPRRLPGTRIHCTFDYDETEVARGDGVTSLTRQLVITNKLVRRVVLLTKLEDAVPLVDTVDDALAALNNH